MFKVISAHRRKNGTCQFFPQGNRNLTLKTQVNRRTNYVESWSHCFILLLKAGNNWEFNPKQSYLLKILLGESYCQIQSKPIFSAIDTAATKWMKTIETPTCMHCERSIVPLFRSPHPCLAWSNHGHWCVEYMLFLSRRKEWRLLYQYNSKNKVAKLFLFWIEQQKQEKHPSVCGMCYFSS